MLLFVRPGKATFWSEQKESNLRLKCPKLEYFRYTTPRYAPGAFCVATVIRGQAGIFYGVQPVIHLRTHKLLRAGDHTGS